MTTTKSELFHNYTCWSCNFFDYSVRTGHEISWNQWAQASLYEHLVEHVEERLAGREMSMSELWRCDPLKSPRSYNLIKKVIYDMAMHGLLVCTFIDRGGKCRRWAINKEIASD